ncbi:MAG: DUF3418 domain-containing protein, partial [Gammaproteobacteria bacterium]
WIFDFYHERLPTQVLTETDLKTYLKRDKRLDAALRFDRKDIMRRAASVSAEAFPDSVQVGENALPLNYEFDPTADSDGVSVDIPLALLNQVSKEQLDWLVPGLIGEKCLALIRSLPKSLRRNFVPAPQVVEEILPALDQSQGTLKEALARQLFRRSAVKIEVSDFQVDHLDKHLSMLVRLVDDEGKLVAVGRDLDALFEQHRQTKTGKRYQHDLERSGCTDWEFGEIPESVSFEQNGIKLRGFPGLVDESVSVGMKVFENAHEAALSHRQGVIRLLRLRLKDQDKYLAKKLTDLSMLGVYYSSRGEGASLADAVVQATFRLTLVDGQPEVRDTAAFSARVDQRGQLFEAGQKMVATLLSALKRANGIEERMASMVAPAFEEAFQDIRAQLAWLFRAGFVVNTPPKWLMEYDRYLEGIGVRLDKLQGRIDKDRAAQLEVKRFGAKLNEAGLTSDAVSEFEGLIQEYRISLFAQNLRTKVPVSTKRLEQALAKAMST